MSLLPVADERWALHQGDALDLLRQMPDGSVDAVVTDPPYGEGVAAWDAGITQEWHRGWLAELPRVLRSGAPVIAFASRRNLDLLMGAMREVFGDSSARPLQSGAWVHRQGFSIAPGMLRPEHEPFVASGRLRVSAPETRRARTYFPGPARVNRKAGKRTGFGAHVYERDPDGPMGGTVLERTRKIHNDRSDHPTQKPVPVMAYFVALAAGPGAVVLDPYAGSGTTGVACLAQGSRFVGFELDAHHVATARRRLSGGAMFAEATA